MVCKVAATDNCSASIGHVSQWYLLVDKLIFLCELSENYWFWQEDWKIIGLPFKPFWSTSDRHFHWCDVSGVGGFHCPSGKSECPRYVLDSVDTNNVHTIQLYWCLLCHSEYDKSFKFCINYQIVDQGNWIFYLIIENITKISNALALTRISRFTFCKRLQFHYYFNSAILTNAFINQN